jgi:signal transduction histidine kinase
MTHAPDIFCTLAPHAFPSILTNLIHNAFQYSNDLVDVIFNLKKLGNAIILEVIDRGIGTNDNEKKMIFEQFYRSGSEETRKAKGTGLGLYIVKYLVDKHNGTISVVGSRCCLRRR